MKQNKKTFYFSNSSTLRPNSHNKNNNKEKNSNMLKDKDNIKTVEETVIDKNSSHENECKIHVMPPTITDEDINALFNGIINVMRKKIELESRSQIININANFEKVSRELKAKQAECIRLKNEILYLKSLIKE